MKALTICERKQMISELQMIKDEQMIEAEQVNKTEQEIKDEQEKNEFMLIDLMREYFSHDDYADLFNMEREERIKITQKDYDIRKYTFYCLQRFIPTKYNISGDYVSIKKYKSDNIL